VVILSLHENKKSYSTLCKYTEIYKHRARDSKKQEKLEKKNPKTYKMIMVGECWKIPPGI
jgi:hypothetical protein